MSESQTKEGVPRAVRPLLRIRELAVSFPSAAGRRRAVDGVSLTVYPGQTLAVVGESGSGKSLTALSVLRLVPPESARFDGGRVLLGDGADGADLLQMSESDLRRVRGNRVAMIFQEPMTSLNPVFTIGEQILEAIRLHRSLPRDEAHRTAVEALTEVGIAEAERRLGQYPHEFSGGMRQRAMIAMALACRPRLLLADEPTTALDVTVQAQVLTLLRDLRQRRGMGILLITHAMGVVAEQADVVCVMYAGRVVEYARVGALFDRPLHPYTRGLLASVPRLDERRDRLVTIRDVIGNPEEFRGIGPDGVRPWWPGHEAPTGAAFADGRDSVLWEVEPGHWVHVWKTGPAALARPSEPDLPPDAESEAPCAP